jgi:hypothetical protein
MGLKQGTSGLVLKDSTLQGNCYYYYYYYYYYTTTTTTKNYYSSRVLKAITTCQHSSLIPNTHALLV